MSNNIGNPNFLSQFSFKFSLNRLPHVQFFTQRVSLPGIDLGHSTIATPFKNIPLPGSSSIEFSPLMVTFKIDEDMNNYIELYNWLTGLGSPQGFEQYNNLIEDDPKNAVSDGNLIILTNSKNHNISIDFVDLFPTSISPLELSSSDSDVSFLTATASFYFQHFKFSSS